MIFSELVIALILPLGTALASGVLALVLVDLGKRRFAHGVGAFALLWLGFWSSPSVIISLWGAMESEFPAP